MSSSEAKRLTNGKHPIERDLHPVLLLVGHRNAVVDLPVEQTMTFRFLIILKAAQALGITLPPHLLTLADEVIQ